jgi:hypothetical protein
MPIVCHVEEFRRRAVPDLLPNREVTVPQTEVVRRLVEL